METRATYQIIEPESLANVQIGLSPRWHKILLHLQQLERKGQQLALVQFTRRGPRVCEVQKLEGD